MGRCSTLDRENGHRNALGVVTDHDPAALLPAWPGPPRLPAPWRRRTDITRF